MKLLKNRIFIAAAALIVGAALTVGVLALTKKPENGGRFINIDPEAENNDLVDLAYEVVTALRDKDFNAVADIVHPVYGVVFTPYSTVHLGSDRCISADEMEDFEKTKTVFVWYRFDSTGELLSVTQPEYYARYIMDKDYTKAPVISVDTVSNSGNSLENVKTVFSNARFVDFHYPGSAAAEWQDWSTLRLVFEDYEGRMMLTCIIHCEYTA